MKALIEIETNDRDVLNAIVKQLEVYNVKPVVRVRDTNSVNDGLNEVIESLERQITMGYNLDIAIACNEILKSIQNLLK